MKILIVDDHPLYRQGLKALMLGLNPEVEVDEASSVPQALGLLAGVQATSPRRPILKSRSMRCES